MSLRAAKQKEKKQKESCKSTFVHPMLIRWPALGTAEAEVVLRRLAAHCRGLERQRVLRKPYNSKVKDTEIEEKRPEKKQRLSIRSQMLCVGINSVTKALEKGEGFIFI
jgi:hypothetical protein